MPNSDRLHNRKQLKTYRRQLRKQMTPAERRLWQMLRNRQLDGRKFRRQHSVGPYILDFYCAEEALAVELDGAPHAAPNRREYDDARTRFFHERGIRVVRFENSEVFEQVEVVLDAITSQWRNR